MNSTPPDRPLVIDGTGMLCAVLLLHLRGRIADLHAGTRVHVIADDPAAPLDLAAWCHLTGHSYLGPLAADQAAGQSPVYALTVAEDAKPTHPTSPWRPADVNTSGPRRPARGVSHEPR